MDFIHDVQFIIQQCDLQLISKSPSSISLLSLSLSPLVWHNKSEIHFHNMYISDDETLLTLALHFTHSKWSILFYIFMSFNQPRQLYSSNNPSPYIMLCYVNGIGIFGVSIVEGECMIMVYNNENDDDERSAREGDGWWK